MGTVGFPQEIRLSRGFHVGSLQSRFIVRFRTQPSWNLGRNSIFGMSRLPKV